MIDELKQLPIEIVVKGMWFKYLDQDDEVKEIVLPVRATNATIKEHYLKDVRILDQHIVEQVFHLPYSTLLLDGEQTLNRFPTTKYVSERNEQKIKLNALHGKKEK